MAHTITFAHFKGGTGKTTSCLSIAGYLARHGSRTLVIDLDPQSNLTSGLGVDNSDLKYSMYHVMSKTKPIHKIIGETIVPNMHLAPATPQLVHTTIRKYETKADAHILKKAIETIKNDYDFILIDTPPNNGHFIANGVLASDSLVLVLDAGVFALEGIDTFKTAFKSYCKKLGADLNIAMALVTKHKKTLNPFKKTAGQEIQKKAEKILEKSVLLIPHSDEIYHTHKKGIPISHHKPYSEAGLAYMKAAEELIKLGSQ